MRAYTQVCAYVFVYTREPECIDELIFLRIICTDLSCASMLRSIEAASGLRTKFASRFWLCRLGRVFIYISFHTCVRAHTHAQVVQEITREHKNASAAHSGAGPSLKVNFFQPAAPLSTRGEYVNLVSACTNPVSTLYQPCINPYQPVSTLYQPVSTRYQPVSAGIGLVSAESDSVMFLGGPGSVSWRTY